MTQRLDTQRTPHRMTTTTADCIVLQVDVWVETRNIHSAKQQRKLFSTKPNIANDTSVTTLQTHTHTHGEYPTLNTHNSHSHFRRKTKAALCNHTLELGIFMLV